jgi:Uma2 family endonuclease
MTMLVLDREVASKFIHQRRETGNDRWDEVWDGVYIIMPNPNMEHQDIGSGLVTVFRVNLDWNDLGKSYQGVNVSDRLDDWTRNYRCPDVAVYLKGNPAQPRGAYSYGGPDFAVEIISPDDRSRDKFGFYASVGVRELLLIDRDPWALELYQRRGEEWVLTGRSTPERPDALASAVLPLSFRLAAGEPRPTIEVARLDGSQTWTV